ncbi:MAG: pilus assembly protein, partial [Pseudomonadota bacterium]
VFAGAVANSEGLDLKRNGRVVLSSLEHNGTKGGNAGQTIVWQRCWGDDSTVLPAYGVEGDGKNNDDLEDGLGAGGNNITVLPDTAVMFVEATYDYQPLLTTGFFDPPRIRYESAFNVRGRQNNDISNSQGLVEMTC